MNYLDLVIIVILLLSIFIGYKKGFLKEFYNLIIMILAILFGSLFKNIFGNLVINLIPNNDIKSNQAFQMFKSIIIPAIGVIIAYIIFYIILKIIIVILIKRKVLPVNKEFLRYGGIFIALVETLFILSALFFSLSFLSYANIDYYDKSLLAKPILMLDPPLYRLSNKLHIIIDNTLDMMKNTSKYKTDPNAIFTDPKSIETIELLFETGILNEKTLIESSKELLKNVDSNKLKLNEINFDEIKNTEQFTYFKNLYKKDIINDDLIRKLVEENNLAGLDVEKLINALKE